ncbi:MAG: NADP oxidoreductase [Bacteroidetes bacterium]|nr:MAG: NADP oxidoreductase [Bacteroidota bacterium]
MSSPSTFPGYFPVEPARSQLLAELWQHQLQAGYISAAAIQALAGRHHLSAVEVEGVASFYHFFHRQPAGRHTIYLNNSILAELRGFDQLQAAFETATGARIGTVDPTGTFGLFTTPCIGLSDQEPAALIDFYPFTHLTTGKVQDIVQQLQQGARAADLCDHPADHIRYTPPAGRTIFFAPYARGEAIRQLPALGPEGVLEQLRIADLKGRGGAFFPTHKKWAACRATEDALKFIVCNADEGEPGTFKDRVLLHSQPGSVLEGMVVAGYTVGARYGILYLRGEYRWLAPTLHAEIAAFRAAGLLGTNVGGMPGFDFDIRLEIGAGAYVCGEETALLESLEGKRGEPRTKWFYPVEKGYLQRPTVINNVETFAAATRLLQLGTTAYLQRGIPGSAGTKLISVAGDCQRPGIYEIEWGMTVGELLDLCGAQDPFFLQVSGPSGECIPATASDRRISLLDLPGGNDIRCGGSFMIFNRGRDLVSILQNFARFFKHESCGVCTPCRAGNFLIERKLERLQNGLADRHDLEDLKSWGHIMKATSRCGLGKTATHTLVQAIEKFPAYFAARFADTDNSIYRKFDLAAAVADYEKYKPKS